MTNEKALYSDGMDSVEALLEIEQVFNVHVPDEKAQSILNVGHLYDFICEALPSGNGKKCASSMTFCRLRKSLSKVSPNSKLTPETPLNVFICKTPKRFWQDLKQSSALNLPSLNYTIIGKVGFILGAIFTFAIVVSLFKDIKAPYYTLLLLPIFLSVLLVKIDPMQLPIGIPTIGELSQKVASLNYGTLVRQGARSDETTHWNLLIQILADYSEGVKLNQITRSTTFY